MMGGFDPMVLSLGEWIALCEGWNKAHGKASETPPGEDEFEAALIAARGG